MLLFCVKACQAALHQHPGCSVNAPRNCNATARFFRSTQVNMAAQKVLPGVYSLLIALTSPGRYALCAEPDTPPSDKPLHQE